MPLLEEGRQYANVIAEQRRIVNSQIRERLDEGGESDVGIVEPTGAERQDLDTYASASGFTVNWPKWRLADFKLEDDKLIEEALGGTRNKKK